VKGLDQMMKMKFLNILPNKELDRLILTMEDPNINNDQLQTNTTVLNLNNFANVDN